MVADHVRNREWIELSSFIWRKYADETIDKPNTMAQLIDSRFEDYLDGKWLHNFFSA